ncbi:MAG: toll/interleukin-1 receptor domain-containing protein [Planctomycetes bacterium]|nr:toll/interleukin-1 receptor domain-containing protein [Planctomycetota bacterium]
MSESEMYPYRVFVSYSHDDKDKAMRVVERLRDLKARPLWDPEVHPGVPFSEQIREMVSFAHVFLPLLTERSRSRPWVHQEIGYAMALGVPVLPLGLGQLPEGMPEKVQALMVDTELRDLGKRLTGQVIQNVVSRAQEEMTYTPLLCAPHPEDRTLLLNEYARAVLRLGETGRIRHAAPFGTFTLPDRPPADPLWDRRDGPHKRSQWLRSWFRKERCVMEAHAKASGCDLILYPFAAKERLDTDGGLARLEVLTDFLDRMEDDKVRVVIREESIRGNLLIVGDWFVAETVSPSQGRGFLHTIITRHAPTVLERVRRFDKDFEESLSDPSSSRGAAREKVLALRRKVETRIAPR